jgi:hypothetical protein
MPALGDDHTVAPQHQIVEFEPSRLDIVDEPQNLARIDPSARRRTAAQAVRGRG